MDRSDAGRRHFRPGRLSRSQEKTDAKGPGLRRILGIKIRILSAPLGGAAGPDLVAAVSNSGTYGVIRLWGDPADNVRDGIRRTRDLTDRNFAVNLNMTQLSGRLAHMHRGTGSRSLLLWT